MRINIHSNGLVLDGALREHIGERISSTLSRFNNLIRKVEVYLTDQNGPKGGVDMLCLVRINGDNMQEIVIKDTEADSYSAVSRALARAKQTLARKIGRTRAIGHQRFVIEPDLEASQAQT